MANLDHAPGERGGVSEQAHPEQSYMREFGARPPVHTLNRGERVMWVLAKLAIEVLDAEREATGVDEWDESDTRCYLYNAAYAVLEHRPHDALDYEDDGRWVLDPDGSSS